MRLWMALLALGPACGFSSNPSLPMDAPADTAPVDTAPRLCFGSFVQMCFNDVGAVPTDPFPLGVATIPDINTDISTLCNPNLDVSGDYCILAGAGFTIAANQTLRAYGNKPLVLLSTSSTATFEILGSIDVSSNHNVAGPTGIGAGSNPVGLCAFTSVAQDFGGGPGGSFGGKGGNGEQVGGGSGGISGPVVDPAPTKPRGGCQGGAGSALGGGDGGAGGGAVDVIALAAIHLEGAIYASGAGGKAGALAGANGSGGGGGGSGGMIVLDTTTVTGTGMLVANGGGGGQGGPAGDAGGESTVPSSAAAGGNNQGSKGGTGGAGGYTVKANGLNGQGSSNPGGGGGGGGGLGVIRAPAMP